MSMTSSLTNGEKRILRDASRDSVQRRLRYVRRYFPRGKWLSTGNRYRDDCTSVLRRDRSVGRGIDGGQLGQYLAVSSILHCAAGWTFLGDAISCHARGDRNGARHLAYYAELRGAMALLATEGVGVFDEVHYVLDGSGNCRDLGSRRLGTHTLAWDALEQWAGSEGAAKLLATVITPHGVPLKTWFEGSSSAASLFHIGKDWLTSWGFDLHVLSEDRDSRNAASYLPNALLESKALEMVDISHYLTGLWRVFEPSSGSPFGELDKYLLRESLIKSFEASSGLSAKGNPVEYEGYLNGILENILGTGPGSKLWKDFLMRRVDPETPLVIKLARETASRADPTHHIQVVCRAALLLRVATGACAKLLREAGIRGEDVAFWWKTTAEGRGVWDANSIPVRTQDLWKDIFDALQEIAGWQRKTSGSNPSLMKWRRECAPHIAILTECERIALWGLGL